MSEPLFHPGCECMPCKAQRFYAAGGRPRVRRPLPRVRRKGRTLPKVTR